MKIVYLLFGIVCIFYISFGQIEYSKKKLFWLDEAFELTSSCPVGLKETVFGGAQGQSSPSPLYYLLEKSIFYTYSNMFNDVLLNYRMISLVSSLLTLLCLFLWLGKWLGYQYSIIALGLVSGQVAFHYYSAETRPYSLWLMLFTVFNFYCAYLSEKKWSEIRLSQKFVLGILSLCLSLVASPGVMQVLVGLSICAWYWKEEKNILVRLFIFH